MDFAKFLQLDLKKQELGTKLGTKLNTVIKKIDHIEHVEYDPDTEFVEYRKGNFITVIYLKDSILNSYKGYMGEIRTYTRGSDTATVVLEGLNSSIPIKFPINHFKLREV